MNNKLGNYIKQFRGDLSLREFATKIGISHTHLDSIEKGIDPRTGNTVNITVETLKKIAHAMNITVNKLLIDSGEVSRNNEEQNSAYRMDFEEIPELTETLEKEKGEIHVYTDSETGLRVTLKPDKPWEEYTKEEQEEFIADAMDALYEYKRTLKEDDVK